MADGQRLLRAYLMELRRDESFIDLLRDAGLGCEARSDGGFAQGLAEGWMDDMELSTGRMLSPSTRYQVVRFVEGKFPQLMACFRGNMGAARLTMLNILDARFGRPSG